MTTPASEYLPVPEVLTDPEGKPEAKELGEKQLGELQRADPNDPRLLFPDNYLPIGGFLLFCGPSGIGKSVATRQAAISFSIGRAFMAIAPLRPFQVLIIQAENDESDEAEMRDGIYAGLKLTPEERTLANSIIILREDVSTREAFFAKINPLLKNHRPDLLIIDPAFAFLGGNASSQEDVSPFLRNMLIPMLRENNCACILVHHTNKPPTGKEKSTWAAGDFAYLGSGSIEWANAARAVLGIRSIGSHDVFELMAAKRGGRLDWRDDAGEKVYTRYIAHSPKPGPIFWRECEAPDEGKTGRPKLSNALELLEILPPGGMTAGDWEQTAKKECGIKEATFHRERRELQKAGKVIRSKASGMWLPVHEKP